MIGMRLGKDTGFLGSYLIVTGCLLHIPAARKTNIWIFYAVAAAFLFYGTALRHNAIFAAVPFLCWFVWLIVPRKKLLIILPLGFVLWFGLLAGINYVNYGLIKSVHLYPLQELCYLDIFHLNAQTSRYVSPPNGFGNDFSELNEEVFRKSFNSDVLCLRHCFKKYNDGKTFDQQLRLDKSHVVPCSSEQTDTEQQFIAATLSRFCSLDATIVPVDKNFVTKQYPQDFSALKSIWLKRISDAPIPYLKFKARFFWKLCRDHYIYFCRFNALTLLPFCCLTLLYSFSKRLLHADLFPCIMVMWSGCLYLAPLFLCLPSEEIRYLYWFFAASFISLVLFCANSPLFTEIVQTVQRYFQRKLDDEH
jgi:hypothetical protein